MPGAPLPRHPQPTDLAALGVGSQQIHHLDPRHQDLLLNAHLHEFGGFGVNGGEPAAGGGEELPPRSHPRLQDPHRDLKPRGTLRASLTVWS